MFPTKTPDFTPFWCIHPWIMYRWKILDIGNQNAVLMIPRMHLFEQPLFSEYLFRKGVKSGCFCWKLSIVLVWLRHSNLIRCGYLVTVQTKSCNLVILFKYFLFCHHLISSIFVVIALLLIMPIDILVAYDLAIATHEISFLYSFIVLCLTEM